MSFPKASDPYVRWTYDAVGNRITEQRASSTVVGLAYNNADQLTAKGTTSYSYDADG